MCYTFIMPLVLSISKVEEIFLHLKHTYSARIYVTRYVSNAERNYTRCTSRFLHMLYFITKSIFQSILPCYQKVGPILSTNIYYLCHEPLDTISGKYALIKII